MTSEFIKYLESQLAPDSPLQSEVGNIILRVSDNTLAAHRIALALAKKAKEYKDDQSEKILSEQYSDISLEFSNVIFYNGRSVTRAPNVPNKPALSPKGIAKVIIETTIKRMVN